MKIISLQAENIKKLVAVEIRQDNRSRNIGFTTRAVHNRKHALMQRRKSNGEF